MADQVRSSKEGVTLKAYRGDGAALLAFDLDADLKERLAGFALQVTPPKGKRYWVPNRLSFDTPITAATTPAQRRWHDSREAPFQKFHWAHFPPDVQPGEYGYRATAILFKSGSDVEVEPGPSTSVSLELVETEWEKFELGFTRGYVSSQAYVDRFHNAELRKTPKTLDYDTAPFQEQYRWLGFHGRRLVFDFLDEAEKDKKTTLDVFAYDLDEPDVLAKLEALGDRLRIFQDDATLHTGANALEPKARARLEKSAGKDHVRTGHFGRFAHQKVFVLRRGGKAVKVLAGSANFSIRGLYVQSNNLMRFDVPEVAEVFGTAFDQAFEDPGGFKKADVSKSWFPVRVPGVPRVDVSISPHADPAVTIDRVADAIGDADSSVMFAVMELGGTGRIMEKLNGLVPEGRVFSYGMTQRSDGSVSVRRPGKTRGLLVPVAFLDKKVPPPFNKEWSGGSGQTIHHKFVVVDFNDSDPIVFSGSSNLAEGGEKQNNDNLMAVADRGVATAFAVEAIKLVDHYHFRALMKDATKVDPARLKTRKERWWARYYEDGLKRDERLLFAR